MLQQRQRLREPGLVIEFGEANHIAAAPATIAIEQALNGVYEEAWLVIGVQRAHSHPAATAELQQFILKHEKTAGAFGDSFVMKRSRD